jgi:NADPH-dependent 2,4-dienoyl-CoA reductase/sulfur reductase-like enzyme
VSAGEAGARVVLVDDNAHVGGQIWRNRGGASTARQARGWLARLSGLGNVTHLAGSRIVAGVRPDTLLAETPAGAREVRFKSLILATGARELFLPFPGWTLSGVVGAGAFQALVKSGLEVRGKRVLVAGTGPLLLAVAALLRSRGAVVPMILEQAAGVKIGRFAMSLMGSPSKLMAAAWMRAGLLGTAYATDSYVMRVAREGALLRAGIRRGRGEISIDCDFVACGFGLIPNNELAGMLGCAVGAEGFVGVDAEQRTTVERVYAIGELTGIGGAEKAVLEGQIAGFAAVGKKSAASALARGMARSRAFVGRLNETFSPRPELFTLSEPGMIICRCEDVSHAAVAACVSARDAKLQTRCGMGPCQGRVWGPVLQRVFGTEAQMVRAPLFPTSVAMLADGAEGHCH